MNITSLEEHELLRQITFIKRKRTPPSMILLGIILYFKGLSTRHVKEILALLDTNRHHTSIWRWIRKHGESFKDEMWQGEMPPRIVVDETGLRTSSGLVWVYAAIDPRDRRLLYLDVFNSRDALKTWVFFRRMQDIYGTLPRVAVVDGGRWYIEPLKQLGIKRVVMRYGIRNYVERFFKTLKRRLSDFDRFFPYKRGPDYPSYWYWLLAFSWLYNAERNKP